MVQAFRFELVEPSGDQGVRLGRFFGARRFAYNWALRTVTDQLEAFHVSGAKSAFPSLYGLRSQWNEAKHEVAVDGDGVPWWQEISKEVFNDGLRACADGYAAWLSSRKGERAGARVGFPRFRKRGKDQDRFTITQPGPTQHSIRAVSNRLLRIPVLGEVRTKETMRDMARLIERGMARILAVTVKREAGRLFASLRVEIIRPQRHHQPHEPHSRVGVDVGERCLAAVAAPDGTIIERVANPAPLKAALTELRRLNRKLSRQKKGSARRNLTRQQIRRMYHRIGCIRRDALHKLTTRLVKTHGEIVIEDLHVAGLRRGRNSLRDANLGEFKRQMQYKADWYNTHLIFADRWFPSTKTCHACGHVNDNIGSKQVWTCPNDACGVTHDRDDNAAINLARWEPKHECGPVRSDAYRGRQTSRQSSSRGSGTHVRPAHQAGNRTAAPNAAGTTGGQTPQGVQET